MFQPLKEKSWVPVCLLALWGLILYARTLFFGLTYLDDNVWILDYQWFLKTPVNLYRVFLAPDLISRVFYRPVLSLSFIINAFAGGTKPFVYHLTNIFIHVFNTGLVFVLFREMRYPRRLSFFAGAVFLTHPVMTGAVAWIPGRTDSFLAVFVLLSFLFFIKYITSQKEGYFIAHLCCFAVGFFVKETAVVLPAACLAYWWLIAKQRKWMLFYVLCWGLILMALMTLRAHVLLDVRKTGMLYATQTVLTNSSALVSYFGKVFLPVNLSVLPVLEDITPVWGVLVLIIMAVGVGFSKTKRLPVVLFGALWFLIFLTPSLVLSFLKHEYRLYLPLIGGLMLLLEIDAVKNILLDEKKGLAALLIVAGALSAGSFLYSARFQDRITFWESAVKTSPHAPLAHRNLGAMYFLDKRYDEAAAEYKQALDLNPYEAMAHNNLGLIYANRNMPEEAEKEYLQEIRINPDYANVYFNLGLLYYGQGKTDQAIKMWEKTVELEPKYVQAYRYLAMYYYNVKDYHKAGYYYNQLRRLGADDPALKNSLKKVLRPRQ